MRYSIALELLNKHKNHPVESLYISNIVPVLFKNIKLQPGSLVTEEEEFCYIKGEKNKEVVIYENVEAGNLTYSISLPKSENGKMTVDIFIKDEENCSMKLNIADEENLDDDLRKLYKIINKNGVKGKKLIGRYSVGMENKKVVDEKFVFVKELNERLYSINYSLIGPLDIARKVIVKVYDKEALHFLESQIESTNMIMLNDLAPKIGMLPDEEYHFDLNNLAFVEIFSEFMDNVNNILLGFGKKETLEFKIGDNGHLPAKVKKIEL